MNGKNYGIPQSRDRIYCVGFKKETKFKYPAPIPLNKTVFDFLQTNFEKKYFLKKKGVSFITKSINYQKSYTQINGDVLLCQKRNQQFNWHGDFVFHPKMADDNRTPENDENLFDVRNLETQYFISNHIEKYAIKTLENNVEEIVDVEPSEIDRNYGRFRKMTPRECLRLMGFDDTFKIVCSDTETYKQAGNSIIVDVFIALLKQMDITKYGYEG